MLAFDRQTQEELARFGSAQQNAFDGYLLDAIAAVVVDGTGNTIIGLLILGVLNNGLDHVHIDNFIEILIRGLILLAALIMNVYVQAVRESEKSGLFLSFSLELTNL